MKTNLYYLFRSFCALLILSLLINFSPVSAQTFVHPGLLHSQTDLTRMKTRVAEGAQPWLAGWNLLIQDPKAQGTYNGRAAANMNNRSVMSDDAIAAYLNALRWYISGNTTYAQCAIGILNNYSNTVNQIPSGGTSDIDGLGGIGVSMMCNAAEIMKLYTGWASADITKFKNMMVNYFYPLRYEFLTNHRGTCISNYWANWDANNITACLAIGVVADNQAIYDFGYNYFLNGAGEGSINHAVPFVHAGGLGQWQESGRDQDHAQLGVGLLGDACQIAWNQGQDLFGVSANRLLAGAEYTAKYNMMQSVPFTTYNNCQPANHDWPAINARGKIHERPIWEMLYNHYVVRKGLSAPFVQGMASLVRPEGGSKDHLGYGTLTYTLNPSTYPPNPIPSAPLGVTATAGTSQVILTWQPPTGLTATGYVIQRSTSATGSFETIATNVKYINTTYRDNAVTNGTTYYYRIAAVNQAGTGVYSALSGAAKPLATGALPSGWLTAEIGSHNGGSAGFANVNGGTYAVNGFGTWIGGTGDNVTFVYKQATGDGTITGRINRISGTLLKTGLMIRESLNADAKAVAMTLGEGGWRFARMGYRTVIAASMGSVLGNTYTWQPAWFRITRAGNTFTAYESSNGTTWFQVGTATISMAATYYIGLVVTSGNATAQNTTIFDNVAITAAGGVGNGSYVQIKNRGTGLVLDGMGRTVNGDSCGQWANSTTSFNSHWEQISVAGGNYQLRNRGTGLVLDGMGLTANGAKVGQYANSTTHVNSHWTIQLYSGAYYRIQNVGTGLYLDGMGRTANGANCGQYANTTSNNAQWELVSVSSAALMSSSETKSLLALTRHPKDESTQLKIFPNPSDNLVTILLPASEGENSLQLIDGAGKVVASKTFKGTDYTLNIADLPSGLYILKIKDGTNTFVGKVIRQ